MISHAAVHITDGKGAVLVDFPYDPGTVFAPWSPEGVPRGPKPLCIITHGHPDHFDPEMAPKFCGAILGPKDLAATGKVRHIELQPVVNWNGVSINAFTTPHDPRGSTIPIFSSGTACASTSPGTPTTLTPYWQHTISTRPSSRRVY